MAGHSQPRPFGKSKIIPIFGTISKLKFSRSQHAAGFLSGMAGTPARPDIRRRSKVKMVN